MSSTIFRSSASSREALACPKAKKLCWNPTWAPKENTPNRKMRAAHTAVSVSSGSLVKMPTNTWGISMMASQNRQL